MGVLGCQIESLIQKEGKDTMPLEVMEKFYRKQFGYPIRPDDYGESNVVQVLKELPQLLRVEPVPAAEETNGDTAEDTAGDTESRDSSTPTPPTATVLGVRLIDRTYVRQLGLRVKEILAEQKKGRMEVKAFEKAFTERFETELKLDQIVTDLSGLVELEDNTTEAAADKANNNDKKREETEDKEGDKE